MWALPVPAPAASAVAGIAARRTSSAAACVRAAKIASVRLCVSESASTVAAAARIAPVADDRRIDLHPPLLLPRSLEVPLAAEVSPLRRSLLNLRLAELRLGLRLRLPKLRLRLLRLPELRLLPKLRLRLRLIPGRNLALHLWLPLLESSARALHRLPRRR